MPASKLKRKATISRSRSKKRDEDKDDLLRTKTMKTPMGSTEGKKNTDGKVTSANVDLLANAKL